MFFEYTVTTTLEKAVVYITVVLSTVSKNGPFFARHKKKIE